MKTIGIKMILAIAALTTPMPGPELLGQEMSLDGRAMGLTPFFSGFRMAVPSHHLGETRDVLIRLPDGYSDEEGPEAIRYPVLYVLDGSDYFAPFAGLVEYLTMFDMVPEMIVVAIPQGDRMEELTFSPANEEYGDWPTSGGADAFHRFLEQELVPLIDETFRTHPYRMLAGHSLGGLFAMEAMGRSPELFQATLALSPSIAWNQYEWLKASGTLFDDKPSWRQTLFVSMEPRGAEPDRRLAEFQALVDAEAPEGFEYHLLRYPQENHTSVGVTGFYDALRGVFDGWTMEGEWWQVGPEAVQAHFEALSDRYGFLVSIPETDLVDQAHHGLVAHEAPDEAILLLEFCLRLYPQSADARVGVGEALEWKGEPSAAREWYLQALEVNPTHAGARRRLDGVGG